MTAPLNAATHAAAAPAVVILIPIYQPSLGVMDQFSLDHSIPLLKGRDVRFIGPRGLDRSFYITRYPEVPFDAFEPEDFASIPGYSRLLLSLSFHERYSTFEFMLILQSDAILLRDDLDHWASQPYDYVGAPWPQGVQIHVNLDAFSGPNARTVRAHVGNGGLSLRRVSKCRALLEEFPQALDMFRRTGSSEDLYFSVLGQLSADFVLPNERVAARFSRELQPARYHAVDPQPPMGGHAWWKYDRAYWQPYLSRSMPLETLPAPTAPSAILTGTHHDHQIA